MESVRDRFSRASPMCESLRVLVVGTVYNSGTSWDSSGWEETDLRLVVSWVVAGVRLELKVPNSSSSTRKPFLTLALSESRCVDGILSQTLGFERLHIWLSRYGRQTKGAIWKKIGGVFFSGELSICVWGRGRPTWLAANLRWWNAETRIREQKTIDRNFHQAQLIWYVWRAGPRQLLGERGLQNFRAILMIGTLWAGAKAHILLDWSDIIENLLRNIRNASQYPFLNGTWSWGTVKTIEWRLLIW